MRSFHRAFLSALQTPAWILAGVLAFSKAWSVPEYTRQSQRKSVTGSRTAAMPAQNFSRMIQGISENEGYFHSDVFILQ